MVNIKLVFQEVVRKFQVPDENCFDHIKSLVIEITQGKFIPVLLYLDEDNDWITISTESDLVLCFETMNTPKIHITYPKGEKMIALDPENVKQFRQNDSNPRAQEITFAMTMDNESKADIPDLEIVEEIATGKESKESTDERAPVSASRDQAVLPLEWKVLVEDFLTNQKESILNLVNEVFEGVEEGKNLKTLVMNGIKQSSFCNHLFILNALVDFEKMLEKTCHMSMLLLQAGKDGLQMAVPLLLRGYAKMKAGEGDGVIDLAPIFHRVFPQMTSWLKNGLADGEEVTFDLGRVMRFMAEKQKDYAPSEPKESLEETNAAAAGIVIHKGVTCDICTAQPIIGVRYKCMTCLDFDMCEFCRRGNHPADHPLITLQAPVPRGGFKFEEGHLKGATEFFKPKWMQDKEKCEGVPKPDVDANGAPPKSHTRIHKRGPGFRGRGWRRRRGNQWRNHHGGPPFRPGRGLFGPRMHGSWHDKDDFDESSSSSTTSSSDEECQKTSKERIEKKNKNRLRKLKKKERKLRRKINKLVHNQSTIVRGLHKLRRKEGNIMKKVAKLSGNADFSLDETPMLPPPNNPGHDRNPNTRLFAHPQWRPNGCPSLYQPTSFSHEDFLKSMHTPHDPNPNTPPFEISNWRPCRRQRPFQAPLIPSETSRNNTCGLAPSLKSVEPTRIDDKSTKDYKFAAELLKLKEMGFYDVAMCKHLLDETNGDIFKVTQRIGFGPNRTFASI